MSDEINAVGPTITRISLVLGIFKSIERNIYVTNIKVMNYYSFNIKDKTMNTDGM